MKNKISILLALTIHLFISSCKKDNSQIDNNKNTESFSRVNGSKALVGLNLKARGITFATLLTPKEKFAFLNERLDRVINELHLDGKKLEVINDIRSKIKADLYVKDSKTASDLIAYEPEWKRKALEIFGKQELKYIVSSFQTYEEYKESLLASNISYSVTAGAEAPKECDCKDGADCDGTGEGCFIKNVVCTVRTYYCGTFNLFDCKGLCKKA